MRKYARENNTHTHTHTDRHTYCSNSGTKLSSSTFEGWEEVRERVRGRKGERERERERQKERERERDVPHSCPSLPVNISDNGPSPTVSAVEMLGKGVSMYVWV